MEVMRIENLSFWYPDSNKPSLEDINLSINEGELVLIVGPSGCGKSTLIRTFNRTVPDFSGGRVKGRVFLYEKNIREVKREEIVRKVGMVYQHPEKQIVLQDVEREIAFGLENLNTDKNKMKRNTSEVISLLGLSSIKDKETHEISGGEKQRVAIASVVSMDPEIIIFDEPISQLDPISSEEVLNSIKKLNRDMGKTIVLVEQRLDRCFDIADKIIFMEEGRIVGKGTPHTIPKVIREKYHMPNLAYVFRKAGFSTIPVNVKEARDIIKDLRFQKMEVENDNSTKKKLKENKNVLEVNKVNFSYERGVKTLKDVSFNLKKGEVLTVMGENGAGKSTMFKIITGLIDKFKGEVKIENNNIKKLKIKDKIKKIGYLSQNPNDYFGRETVFEEVAYTLKNIGEYDEKRVNKVIEKMDINHLKNRNPRDLSGGEKQRTAIACTMVTDPEILILDEPTRGMDAVAKENLGNIITTLSQEGKSIVLITHDSDFAADYSNRVMLMFNGEVVAQGDSEEILYDSIYYSPQIAKVFKNKCKVIKTEEAVERIRVR